MCICVRSTHILIIGILDHFCIYIYDYISYQILTSTLSWYFTDLIFTTPYLLEYYCTMYEDIRTAQRCGPTPLECHQRENRVSLHLWVNIVCTDSGIHSVIMNTVVIINTQIWILTRCRYTFGFHDYLYSYNYTSVHGHALNLPAMKMSPLLPSVDPRMKLELELTHSASGVSNTSLYCTKSSWLCILICTYISVYILLCCSILSMYT